MADEPTSPTEPVATTPESAPPEPPPVVDPVAELRERLARSEGEIQALRSQVATATAPRAAPPAEWTPAGVRQAYDAGQITDDQRVALLADLQAQARISTYDQTRRAQVSQEQAGAALQAYIQTYPALSDPHSPLMREVVAELSQLQAEGWDARDLRAQLRATKSVLGALKPGPAGSTARRSIPIGSPGTPGSGTPGGPGGKADPLKGIPADLLDDWKRLGAKLDDPVVAARYADRYHGMLARRSRRTQGVA